MVQKFFKEKVNVIALFTEDGEVIPKFMFWEDKQIEIKSVIEAKQAASLKVGGQGTRYKCKINGKEKFLFREDDIWFVEATKPQKRITDSDC